MIEYPPPARRLEAADVAQRADLGARLLRARQVGVVERVLGAVVAADVALAAHLAGRAVAVVQVALRLLDLLARDRRPAVVGERDRQRRVKPLEPAGLGRLLEGERLRRRRVRLVVGREPLQRDDLLDVVVVRIEVLAGDRPVFVAAVVEVLLDEPLLVLADEHVRVDQRAAAQARGHERVDAPERPVVVHAGQPVRGVPEALARPVRAAGERAGRVRAAALEHEHALARVRQPVGRHRSAEARADDDGVVMVRGHCRQR